MKHNTFLLALIASLLLSCGSNTSTSDKNLDQKSPDEQKELDRLTDSIMKSYGVNSSTNSEQENFIKKKEEEFTSNIESNISSKEIRQNHQSLSKSWLKEKENKIVNWTGTIISLDVFQEKELDISISIMDKKVIGQKNISGKIMDCGITIEAEQATNSKLGYKGVVRNGEICNKIKELKEGDKVVFSATVNEINDNSDKTGLNLSTIFQINITDIKKK